MTAKSSAQSSKTSSSRQDVDLGWVQRFGGQDQWYLNGGFSIKKIFWYGRKRRLPVVNTSEIIGGGLVVAVEGEEKIPNKNHEFTSQMTRSGSNRQAFWMFAALEL